MSEALDNSAVQQKRRRSKKQRAKVASIKGSKPSARAQVDRVPSRWKEVSIASFLLAVSVLLGMQISNQSQQMRTLYSELQQGQAAQDALLEQRSRLLLERGALNSFNGAEKLAADELNMSFPKSITPVMAEDDANGGVIVQRPRRSQR